MSSNPSAASSDFTLVRVRGASLDPNKIPVVDEEHAPLARPLQLADLTGNNVDMGIGCKAADPSHTPPKGVAPNVYTSKDDMRLRSSLRWRAIIFGAGILLLCVLLLWGATNESAPPSSAPAKEVSEGKLPSNQTFTKFLSPEEEAMFGQYQAVGLGDETLEEAYAPVPRTYVAPPNGDIYSTFGIVIATFSPHALMLSRFFDSMAKFCLDCHRVRIVLIIPATEMDLFTNIRDRHIKQLPGIEVVPFSHVFPALNMTLAIDTPGWNAGWTGWDEERLLHSKDKAIFQSFKKVYGCLYLATEYCMLLDSEGFFIRQATLADIYGGYRKSPYLVYSSYLRQRFFATRSAQDLLGYHENYGWALEEYNWVLDTNIIAELERIFRRARPNLDKMEPLVFIEVVYWIYMLHNRHRYHLRVLDTANLFGLDVLNRMRKQVNFNDDAITVWEDLRWFMEKDPALVDLAVDIFNRNKFKMIKIGKTKESIEFLEQAASVVLCVSEQPDDLYEMAMKGHFNQTFEPRKKQDLRHEEGKKVEVGDH